MRYILGTLILIILMYIGKIAVDKFVDWWERTRNEK